MSGFFELSEDPAQYQTHTEQQTKKIQKPQILSRKSVVKQKSGLKRMPSSKKQSSQNTSFISSKKEPCFVKINKKSNGQSPCYINSVSPGASKTGHNAHASVKAHAISCLNVERYSSVPKTNTNQSLQSKESIREKKINQAMGSISLMNTSCDNVRK